MNEHILFSITPSDFRQLVADVVSTELAKHRVELTTSIAPPPADDLLSRKEAAQLLKISLVSLREYERRGMLRPVRIGRRVLFRRSDLDAALNRSREGRR